MTTLTDRLVIEDIELAGGPDQAACLRATIDGHEVRYSIRGAPALNRRAEPMLAAAIFPAMVQGRPVRIQRTPISPRLLRATDKIQRLINLWNPETHRVPIETETEVPEAPDKLVTSSFSGGIDSMSTFVNHADDITHLLHVNGFVFRAKESWKEVEDRFLKTAATLGRKPVSVNTNVGDFLADYGVSMLYAHGSVLASLMDFLAAQRGYIASSYTYRELKPWGSHPCLDALWSTETTEILHDGLEHRRSEKTAIVASQEDLLDLVQVCWESTVRNCGKCQKCVRTMLALHILDIPGGPFPDVNPVEYVNKLRPYKTSTASFIWDLWYLARERGKDDIARKLEKLLVSFRRKRAARNLIKEFIGQRATRRLKRLRGETWLDGALPLGDPDDLR